MPNTDLTGANGSLEVDSPGTFPVVARVTVVNGALERPPVSRTTRPLSEVERWAYGPWRGEFQFVEVVTDDAQPKLPAISTQRAVTFRLLTKSGQYVTFSASVYRTQLGYNSLTGQGQTAVFSARLDAANTVVAPAVTG